MKDTGIVRRIDSLGRVVIPKEIRKTHRIVAGDPIEIYADKEGIIIKKYSPLARLVDYGCAMSVSLSKIIGKPTFITDTDKVLCSSSNKYDILGKTLTAAMDKLMFERKTVDSSKADGDNLFPLIRGEDIAMESRIVSPIISNGDCFGAVVVFDTTPNGKFTPEEVKLCTLASTYLGRQFE